MAWLQATAASSHHAPCSPRPPCSHSSSAVVHLVTRMCSTAATTTRDSGGSSPFPPPFAIGGTRKKRTGLSTVTSSCFREDPTLHSHPFYHLLREQKRNWSRGCRMTDSIRCRGTGEGARLAVEQVDKEVGEDARILALESELYDFMHKSSKPSHFPTKAELIAAGRMDLVEAIAEIGGWLSYGWDFGDDEAADTGSGYDDVDDDGGYEEKGGQVHGGERRSDAISSHRREADSGTDAVEHDETADGWQDDNILRQQREMSVVKESGIEGILNRLEKERSSSYLEADNGISSMNKDSDPDAADSEVVLYGNRYGVDGFLTEIHMDNLLNRSVNDMRKGSNEPKSSAGNDLKNIHTRLQVLEMELDSVLSSLRSRTGAVSSDKGQENTVKELDELSDALEFLETEIMSAHDKIRCIRAKLAALEGKMALEIIEAQTIAEEMRKRIDAAHKALCLLHTAYVVWPSTASEVFLIGSFDSWTNQMRMEKSSTGVFYLCLKLYPGRYEIKFVVDGVWKIDPLLPVVYNNGHENNLLIIPSERDRVFWRENF